MRKTFHLLLSSLIASSMTPFKVFAIETPTLNPVFVQGSYLNKDVPQLKEELLKQERLSRNEEDMTRALAQQNAILVGKMQELQKTILMKSKEPKVLDLVDSINSLEDLRIVMETYSRQLDERNRQMMMRNEQTIDQRARISKLEALYKETLSVNSNVEALKKEFSPIDDKKQEKLESQFKSQKDFLQFKAKTLDQKYKQLVSFKQQLLRTQEELQSANHRLEDLAGKNKYKTEDQLNLKTDQLKKDAGLSREYEESLKDKDSRLMQLQEQILNKDQEISQLKMELIASKKLLIQSQESLAEKEKIIVDQKKSMDNLHQDLVGMQRDMADLKFKFTHYDEGFELIQTRIIDLKKKLVDVQARAAQKDELISQLKEQNKISQKTIIELREQLKTLSNQVNSLKNDMADFLTMKDRLRLYDVVDSGHHMLEKLSVEKASLLTQLLQSNQERKEYYRDQLKKTIVYWQELNQGSETQLEALKKEASDKEVGLKDLQKQLENAQKNSAQLESMLDVYQKKAEDKEGVVKKKAKDIDQLQDELQKTAGELSQREKDFKKVKDYFFEMEKNSANKSKELRDKLQQIALLNELVGKKSGDLSKLQAMLAIISMKLKTSESSLEIQKSKEQSLLDKQKQELASLNERLAVAESKVMSSIDPIELVKSKQFIRAANDEIVVLKANMKDNDVQGEQLKKNATEINGYQKKLETAQSKIKSMMESVYFKDKEIGRLKVQLSKRDNTIKPIVQKFEVAQESKQVSVSSEDLSKATVNLEDANNQIKVLKEELKKKEYQIDHLPKEQVVEGDLKIQLINARKEIAEVRAASHDKSDQSIQLSEQVKALNARIKSLEEKIKSLKGNPNDS